LPDGRSFRGARELKRTLKGQSEAFVHNVTGNSTYALGRGLAAYDRATVDRIAAQAAAGGYRFSTLVMGIVNSQPFQMRTPEGTNSLAAQPLAGGRQMQLSLRLFF